MCIPNSRCISLVILALAVGCSREKPTATVDQDANRSELADTPVKIVEPVVEKIYDDWTIETAFKAKGVKFNRYDERNIFLKFEPHALNAEGQLKPEVIEVLKQQLPKSSRASLTLGDQFSTDFVLEQISNLPFVTSLSVTDAHSISDEGLAALSRMNRLDNLEIRFDSKEKPPSLMTDEGLAQLAKIESLRRLLLSVESPRIQGSFISAFADHPNLAELCLSGGHRRAFNLGDDQAFAMARGITNLTKFKLHWSNLRGPGLAFLRDCKRLQELHLNCCFDVTDDAFAHVAGLPSLKSVSANSEKLSGETLRHLSLCPSLENINLTNAKLLTDEDVKNLLPLKNLTDLDLSGADNLTDASLASIAQLKNLERLHLTGTQVTDACVEQLASLPRLTGLDLTRTKVTKAGAANLEKNIPTLKSSVLHDGF